jgi:hypothetical protein
MKKATSQSNGGKYKTQKVARRSNMGSDEA